jgi:hypothetical protein
MARANIDVAELKAALSSAKAELERWSHELAAGARAAKHAHENTMAKRNGASLRAHAAARRKAHTNSTLAEARRGGVCASCACACALPWRTGELDQLVRREEALSLQTQQLADRALPARVRRLRARAGARCTRRVSPWRPRRQRRACAKQPYGPTESCALRAAPRRRAAGLHDEDAELEALHEEAQQARARVRLPAPRSSSDSAVRTRACVHSSTLVRVCVLLAGARVGGHAAGPGGSADGGRGCRARAHRRGARGRVTWLASHVRRLHPPSFV